MFSLKSILIIELIHGVQYDHNKKANIALGAVHTSLQNIFRQVQIRGKKAPPCAQ